MEIQFTGFTHNGELREFAFERIADDRSKTRIKVIADLALSRKYRITVQELPLLCRRLLEGVPNGAGTHTLTFTERDMQTVMTQRQASQRKNVHRQAQRRPRPVSTAFGTPFGGPLMLAKR